MFWVLFFILASVVMVFVMSSSGSIGGIGSFTENVQLNFDESEGGKPKYLIFDIETTGLPLWKGAVPEDLDVWPRIVELAWITFDEEGRMIDNQAFLIQQEKRIPRDAIAVHGITNEMVRNEGLPISKVLKEFAKVIKGSEIIVAHNQAFDLPITESEFVRLGMGRQFEGKRTVCTMMSGIDFCKLPKNTGYSGYKYPKLTELYKQCFYPNKSGSLEIEGGHRGLIDAGLTAKCYFKMKELGVSFQSHRSQEYYEGLKEVVPGLKEDIDKPYNPRKGWELRFYVIPNFNRNHSLILKCNHHFDGEISKYDMLQSVWLENEDGKKVSTLNDSSVTNAKKTIRALRTGYVLKLSSPERYTSDYRFKFEVNPLQTAT